MPADAPAEIAAGFLAAEARKKQNSRPLKFPAASGRGLGYACALGMSLSAFHRQYYNESHATLGGIGVPDALGFFARIRLTGFASDGFC